MGTIPKGPWHENPDAWGKIVLGDWEIPGLCTFEPSRTNKWDTPKEKSKHGAKRKFQGVDLGTGRIENRIWTADQWREWTDTGFPILEPGPKAPDAGEPIKIQHAIAAARKFTAITIDTITGPTRDGQFGVIEITFTEYREPDPTNATGGSGGNICTKLAAQLELLRADRIVQASLINGYFLSGDIPLAVAADQKVKSIDAQIVAVQAHQIANGCNQAKPSTSDPDGQLDAENLLF